MNWKRLGIGLLLADFSAFTAWVIWQHGYVSFLQLPLQSPVALQVAIDLVIALGITSAFVWRDARARGVSPLPFLAITAVLGSIGPLLYFVLRPEAEARTTIVRRSVAA
jgi:hypothetical protein